MPHPNLNQDIDFPVDQPGSKESFCLANLAAGANEGLLPVEARRKGFGLTPLERQVIAFLVAGLSNEESAKRIGISGPALRLHRARIYDKLRVSNQLELILFALCNQLIDTSEVFPPCDRKSVLPAEQPRSEEGFYLDDLTEGAIVEFDTQHHHYRLVKRADTHVHISGHPMFCPEPVEVEIEGSVGSRPLLKLNPGFIGRGMYMVFKHPLFDRITTSRIREIRKLG
jgi:DNA-binding CsgD family transcriptional regulator